MSDWDWEVWISNSVLIFSFGSQVTPFINQNIYLSSGSIIRWWTCLCENSNCLLHASFFDLRDFAKSNWCKCLKQLVQNDDKNIFISIKTKFKSLKENFSLLKHALRWFLSTTHQHMVDICGFPAQQPFLLLHSSFAFSS